LVQRETRTKCRQVASGFRRVARAVRSIKMFWLRLASSTNASGHSSFIRRSLETISRMMADEYQECFKGLRRERCRLILAKQQMELFRAAFHSITMTWEWSQATSLTQIMSRADSCESHGVRRNSDLQTITLGSREIMNPARRTAKSPTLSARNMGLLAANEIQ
jgi:hypothetical protein